jgi:hypothetical protein
LRFRAGVTQRPKGPKAQKASILAHNANFRVTVIELNGLIQRMPKICRNCSEDIKETAKVCPYCQNSTGRLGFIIREDLVMVITIVGIGGAFLYFAFLLIHSRDFSKYRNDIVVTQSKVVAGTRDDGKAKEADKVIATVTNKGNHAWRIERVEVRFYDEARKMVDAITAASWASVLPHAEGTLSIDLHSRIIRSNVVSHEVYVQNASPANDAPQD